MHRVISDYSRPDTASHSNIKVYVRSRPIEDENQVTNAASNFLEVDPDDERKITIKDPDPNNRKYSEVGFRFDKLFGQGDSQEEVFQSVCQPQVEHVLNGFNCCCFAYGQTGSGKTYSMFGLDGEIRGLIPRSVEYIFERLKEKSTDYEVAMVCSFLEIYNDQIRDLGKAYLATMGVETSNPTAINEKTSDIFEKFATKRGNSFFADVFHTSSRLPMNSQGIASPFDMMPGLKEVVEGYNTMNYDIREDADGNVFVKDLSMIPVTTLEEVMSIISLGLRVRATHETKMNASSSRSHTIFSINIVQRDKVTMNSISGNLHLVDLAGSERLKKSESQGARLKEALHINSSLTCLGKVIMALDPTSSNSHIPYRESKLTRILQNSLGGNSYTAVLAAIHPNPLYYEECLSTLQFANRCRNVQNNPRVNYLFDSEDKERKIKRLLDEIAQLRNRINQLEFLLKEAKDGRVSIDKMKKIFSRLGLDIIIDKTGNILYNGQRYDVSNIMNDISSKVDVNDNQSISSTDNHAFHNIDHITKNRNIMDEVTQKAINDLKDVNMELTKKNKEKKVLLEEQGRQINDLQLEVVKYKAANQHLLYENEVKMKEKEDNYQLMLSGMKVSYDNDIREVLSHNDVFLSNHFKTLNNIPKTLSTYTSNIDTLKQVKYHLNEKIQAEFNQHLKELECSRQFELNTLQMQFSCYLKEKDTVIAELVEKFNKFRTKKSTYIESIEKEIITLCEQNHKLESILDDVEVGKYRIKQNQSQLQVLPTVNMYGSMTSGAITTGVRGTVSLTGQVLAAETFGLSRANSRMGDIRPSTVTGAIPDEIATRRPSVMGAVILPRGLRPQNMLRRDFQGLSLAKKIYDKHLESTKQAENLRQNTLRKTLNKASKVGDFAELGPSIEDDPVLQDQIGDFLKVAKSTSRYSMTMSKKDVSLISTSLPKTLTTASKFDYRNKNSHDSFVSVQLPPVSSQEFSPRNAEKSNQDSSYNDSLSHDQFHSASDPKSAEMLANAMQRIKDLEQEQEEYMRVKRIQDLTVDKLSCDMSSDKTISYITQLEVEQENLRKQMKDLSRQLSDSKVANASLRRKLNHSTTVPSK